MTRVRRRDGENQGCAGGGAARSPSTRPSGSVTDTNSPPGSPLRNGRSVMLTLSPVLSVDRLPSCANQKCRRRHLHRPRLRAALVVGDVEIDPGVRIGPAELLDRAGHDRDRLGAIDSGRRMMRQRRRGQPEQPSRIHIRQVNGSSRPPLSERCPSSACSACDR